MAKSKAIYCKKNLNFINHYSLHLCVCVFVCPHHRYHYSAYQRVFYSTAHNQIIQSIFRRYKLSTSSIIFIQWKPALNLRKNFFVHGNIRSAPTYNMLTDQNLPIYLDFQNIPCTILPQILLGLLIFLM